MVKGKGKGKGEYCEGVTPSRVPGKDQGWGECSKYASCPEAIPLQSGLCCVVALPRTSSTKTVFRIKGIPSITN